MAKYVKWVKGAAKAVSALYAARSGSGGGGSGGKSKSSKYRKRSGTKKPFKSPPRTGSSKEKKKATVVGVGSHISTSRCTVPARKPPSSYCRKLALACVQEVAGGTVTSSVGNQGVGDVVVAFDSTSWNQLKTQSTVTGAGSTVSGPSGSMDDFRFFIKHIDIEITFSNQGEDMMELIVYDIMPRCNQQGTQIGPSTSWATAIAQSQAGASNTVSFPYNTPEKYKRFTKSWRILKATTVWLPGGGCHRHWFTHGINKVMTASYLDNYLIYSGLTSYVMVVAKGVPRDNSLTAVAAGITLAPTKLIWASRTMVNGSLYNVTPSSDRMDTSLASSATHLYAPLQQEEVGDLISGLTTAVTQAAVFAGFG